MSTILLLCGAKTKDEPIITPGKSEPYHIIWNITEAGLDKNTYVKPSDIDGYMQKVYSLEPLTDYEPLEEWPAIHSPSNNPVVDGVLPWPVLIHDRLPMFEPLLIKAPHLFAHPDRSEKLPKEFNLRFGVESDIPEMDLIRYNLNTSGSRYFALEVKASESNPREVMARLRANLTGTEQSTPFVSVSVLDEQNQTDTIKLFIFEDRISIVRGFDDESAIIQLAEPIIITGSPTIEIFSELNPSAYQSTYVFLDMFMVNDAYW